jgi:hypothetical protein
MIPESSENRFKWCTRQHAQIAELFKGQDLIGVPRQGVRPVFR